MGGASPLQGISLSGTEGGESGMETIFVASSFHEYDRDLVNDVSSVIEALSMRPQAGRNMGGEALEESIKRRIDSCDGLVALFTKRDAADSWQTHPWVVGEFGHALSVRMPAIAIVEDGIDWNVTPWAGRQRVVLHRDRSAEAMLDLVRQLGVWQREAGVTIQVLLSNQDVLQRYMEMPDGLEISYRYIRRARAGDFVKAKRFTWTRMP
jgi:hypothetical protein